MKYVEDSNSLERYRIGKKPKKDKKKYTILYIILAFSIILIVGALYENIVSRNYLNLGKESKILVNDTNYNYKIESEGKYTVIVDGPIGSTLLDRKSFMENFDSDASIFFYERPPYANTKGNEKTPKELAEDLHFMFKKLGFQNKFILVGEEYGSLVMEEFMKLYPNEIEGAIFINPIGQALNSSEINEYFSIKNAGFFSNKILGIFGIPRFLNNTKILDYFDGYNFKSSEIKDIYSNIYLSNDHINAMEEEIESLKTLEKISIKENLIGNNPLYVITSKEREKKFNQKSYLKYSNDSEIVYVKNSINNVLMSNSYEINNTLNRLIRKIFILEKNK